MSFSFDLGRETSGLTASTSGCSAASGKLRSLLGTQRIGACWLVDRWTDCIENLEVSSVGECALPGHITDMGKQ
jgi:hypothetical protein